MSKSMARPETKPEIFIVIVLYRMKAEESLAFTGLQQALEHDPTLGEATACMVCDNSPYVQSAPPRFQGTYLSDQQNVGLAPRYNLARKEAARLGCEWLLLLDQDTSPTPAYLAEALALARDLRGDPAIVAIAPKLMQRGKVLSPHLRIQWRVPRTVSRDAYGVLPQPVQVFNSGALLKVAAIEQIGGFPAHFWLDYLDHATFHLLQAKHGKVFIMHATLAHDLSENAAQQERALEVSMREGNILKASRDYYHRYGSWKERSLFTIQILRLLGDALRRGEMRRLKGFLQVLTQR